MARVLAVLVLCVWPCRVLGRSSNHRVDWGDMAELPVGPTGQQPPVQYPTIRQQFLWGWGQMKGRFLSGIGFAGLLVTCLLLLLLRPGELEGFLVGGAITSVAGLIVTIGVIASRASVEILRNQLATERSSAAQALMVQQEATKQEHQARISAERGRDGLAAELEKLRAAKPVLRFEEVESLPVDGEKTYWFLVFRNDGESARVTAKYKIRGNNVEGWATDNEHCAVWGAMTTIRPPPCEEVLAKGDSAKLRIAETGVERNRGDYPPGTVVRFVRVVGANKLDLIQPYSEKRLVGHLGEENPHCVITVRVFTKPGMEGKPWRASFVVGLGGVRLLALNTEMQSLLWKSTSPAEQLRAAREWFYDIVAAADMGDDAAKEMIFESARGLHESSRAYNASGPGFVADYDAIRRACEGLGLSAPQVPKLAEGGEDT